MADQLKLEIVTPDRHVVNDYAQEVQIPGANGYLGVLPGHAPLISELAVGEISYRKNGHVFRLAVAWGFAEILPDKVTILAETAERPEEIDIEAARRARDEAAARMKAMEADFEQANRAYQVAEARLKVAGASSGDVANIVP